MGRRIAPFFRIILKHPEYAGVFVVSGSNYEAWRDESRIPYQAAELSCNQTSVWPANKGVKYFFLIFNR